MKFMNVFLTNAYQFLFRCMSQKKQFLEIDQEES